MCLKEARGPDEGNPASLLWTKKPASKPDLSGGISKVIEVSDSPRTIQVLAKKPGSLTGITHVLAASELLDQTLMDGRNGDQATLARAEPWRSQFSSCQSALW